MSQPSVSSFFITRKRGIEDELIAQKKKVICLERTRNDSQGSHGDLQELQSTVAVFPKTKESNSSNDDEPKIAATQKTIRQGITPQRRSKRVHMQEVDGIEAPKIVNFWKGGNLSPQKKAKTVPSETVRSNTNKETQRNGNELQMSGMSTPAKKTVSSSQQKNAIEKTTLIPTNGSNLDKIKQKLKGSKRLADLKTSLNKLNAGLDKLDQMEEKRTASIPEPEMRKASVETTKVLKPFRTIELQILR